jgi:hypothetical protein
MRLSTDENRDEGLALATVAAAAETGMTLFDTAHAYGRGAAELGHNERLLAGALRRCGAEGNARIVTQAQVNLVQRLLERFGSLPTPELLRGPARREPGVLAPTSQMRALRELEPPLTDEGLVRVEQVRFVRTPPSRQARVGVYVAAAALRDPGWKHALEQGERGAPHLVFDWSPDGVLDDLAACVARLSDEVSGPVESALCPHAAGPPSCWCRPPLPGLPLAFARAHDVDVSRSILIGAGPAHRTLATILGARYVPV